MSKKEVSEKKQSKLEFWRTLSDEWESGNLTQPKFCQLKNIKLKTFLKWRQKVLREKDIKQKQFLPAHISLPSVNQIAVQSVMLKLPNGISLQISSNTDEAFLKTMFELLGIASC